MISERLSLVLRLIDDDVDQTIEHGERKRMEVRVWALARAEFPQPCVETIEEFKVRMKHMWIATSNICGLRFWTRRLLSLQLDPPRNLAEDYLTIAMGLHPRLGANCMFAKVNVDIVSMIARYLGADIEAETMAVFEAKYALWKYYVRVNMKCPSGVLFYCRRICSDTTQYQRVASVFMDGVDSDLMWKMLLQD
jgi:hypothetical protein